MSETYRKEDEKNGPDAKGAVEEDVQRIDDIKGSEVLGYDGAGREEHSGQNTPEDPENPGMADTDRVTTKE
jgi:hypothetical protein